MRRSRTKGVACRVTLRKGESAYVGEAEGLENERLRIELAARATLSAISQAEGDARVLGLEGCKMIEAFDRQFVFVGLDDADGPGERAVDGECGSERKSGNSERFGRFGCHESLDRLLEVSREQCVAGDAGSAARSSGR